MRTTDVAVAGLVKISPVVLAEVISEEFLVDMLDDREKAPVGSAEGQLRVCVPGRGDASYAEQTPGERFAHLRRIIVHCLEIDPGHSGQPVAVLRRIENYPPGRLRSAQRAVSAVFKREGGGAEQDTFTAGGRNAPTAGRIGIPYVEPGASRGFHRLCDNTPSRTEPGDMEHVHIRAEEFRLLQRRPPVEHLKERAPADNRVHSSPMPVPIPASPVTSASSGRRARV